MQHSLLSRAPEVRLTNYFPSSYDNAVATARTCYSSRGIITSEEVAAIDTVGEKKLKRQEQRDRIAADLYQAGHHTTFQHGYFQFALSNVSRHFIWSFLHSHPFYNSEQVSQRYVTVKPGTYVVPPLSGEALETYLATADSMIAGYQRLSILLVPLVSKLFFERFPARRHQPDRWRRDIEKRAQEVARYVLPIGTFSYLYHTISAITLFRYWRLAEQFDTPIEQKIVIGLMVKAVLKIEPDYAKILEDPIPLEETLEFRIFSELSERRQRGNFKEHFDAELGGRTSKLVDWKVNNEATVAEAVREVLCVSPSELSDDQAIGLIFSPSSNRYFGESLNLTSLSKLTRCLSHAHYTFRKKLSHAADSQDQRHRMIPASRPIFAAQIDEQPDVIIPPLIAIDDEVLQEYESICLMSWMGVARLHQLGVPEEFSHYLLPNSVAIRFSESGDLLSLRHKLAMRLCYNAQEEIWKASVDEADQIRALHPNLGRWLLPPCTLRDQSGVKPPCPEGSRYCGIPIWKIDPSEYSRLI
jgi:thymidylate synthase ThyX